MDHAGMPVMLLRHSHGKMRRDGFRAAWMQPDFAVDERGRLHSAPGLVHVVVSRGQACIRGPCRNRGDHRQWVRNCKTPDRLRRQDKARFLAAGTSFLRFCLHIGFERIGFDATRCGDGASDVIPFVFNGPSAVVGNVRGRRDRTAHADASVSTLLYDRLLSLLPDAFRLPIVVRWRAKKTTFVSVLARSAIVVAGR